MISAVGAEARLTTRRRSGNGAYRQIGRTGILGVAIAIAALYLQLVGSTLHPLPRMAAAATVDLELARLIDAHALCIAADSQAPADEAPASPLQHFAACCPWHGSASPGAPLPHIVEPVAFVSTRISLQIAPTTFAAARLPGALRARGPPIGA